MPEIAVLMTCHNRRETTLTCLGALFANDLPDGVRLQVYLVDDGSTDGTGEAVAAAYPDIHILPGDGSLYWCGGMRKAWTEAIRHPYSALLLLNDDTLLHSNALNVLFAASHEVKRRYGESGIVVGACRDPERGELSYGGWDNQARKKLILTGNLQPCRLMNCNIALIDAGVVEKIGGMSPVYRHSMGDMDYSWRASAAGVPVMLTGEYLADCRGNEKPRWTDSSLPLLERWRSFHGIKGLPPREYVHFLRLIKGWRWPIGLFTVYLHLLCPKVWQWLRRWHRT